MNATLKYDGREVTFLDVDPASHIGNCLLKVGWYEWPNLEFIRSLEVSGAYVDAGAHIGTHAIYYSLFTAADMVYAFEPSQSSAAQLLRNLRVNGISGEKCQVIPSALGESIGAYMPPDAGEQFHVTTLDSWRLPNVKLLKADVEGMELRLLQGARETLRTVEHVFLEIWPPSTCRDRQIPDPKPAIVALLSEHGLRLQGRLPWEDLYYFAKVDRRAEVERLWTDIHRGTQPYEAI